jgi:5-hydroxyisourate hydrolase
MSLSTHVLDAALGRPAAGLAVRLDVAAPDGWTHLVATRTDQDGRVREAFAPAFDQAVADRTSTGPAASRDAPADGGALTGGTYRLVFDTAGYFADRGVKEFFYPEVVVCFTVSEPGAHHHVPLLLSPFAYSTYRGS